MRYFFIDPSAIKDRAASITGSEAHHIKTVLRLKPGDDLKLLDGTGYEYDGSIVNISAKSVDVEIRRRKKAAASGGARIVVAQAFLKEKKMDDLVRKLCELGVSHWIPFFSQRSIARPDTKRLAGRAERWNRIATEAVKQCRRIDTPVINSALGFDDVLKFSDSCDARIVFWENEARPLTADLIGKNKPIKTLLVMLGPEGGFTDQEIQQATDHGFISVGLGPRILRAETATVAAVALAQYLFGDLGPNTGKT